MTETYDHGPLVTYEITWTTGHVERVQAHQVSWPDQHKSMGSLFGTTEVQTGGERVRFHGEIDGRWRMVLEARVEDIRTIRDCATERLDGVS